MMEQEKVNPKVFISYSWKSEEHKNWVIELAENLMRDGIEVKFDVWDLGPGDKMYEFMESMINDPDITHVLIISDESYTRKANDRVGGVGTETQILTPSLYNGTDKNKFLLITTENDANGTAFKPTFYKNRIHIDMSDEDAYNEKYDELIRTIYGNPRYEKP